MRDVDVDVTNWRPRFEKIKQMLITHRGGAFVLHEMRYSAGRAAPPEKRWLPAAVDELLTWATKAGFTFGAYGGSDAREEKSRCIGRACPQIERAHDAAEQQQ